MPSPVSYLIKPLVTEKSTRLAEQNRYVVEVHPDATKGIIRQAIEELYKVNVVSVRTISVPGKFRRRMGPVGGYQSNRKKAIVRIKEGQKISWEQGA